MHPLPATLGLLPDFGGGEMMLVLFAVLLLFGGDKMPQLAKALGRSIREFKKAANEVEREIKKAIDEVPDQPDLKSTWRQVLEDKPKPNGTAPRPNGPMPIAPPGSVPAGYDPMRTEDELVNPPTVTPADPVAPPVPPAQPTDGAPTPAAGAPAADPAVPPSPPAVQHPLAPQNPPAP